jgi:hypothetical protein
MTKCYLLWAGVMMGFGGYLYYVAADSVVLVALCCFAPTLLGIGAAIMVEHRNNGYRA